MHFPREEFLERIHKVRAAMQARELELLVVADPANIHYLTGYDGWSFYTPQVVLLDLEEEQPTWIGRIIDRNGGRHTAWIDEEHLVGYPDTLIHVADHHPLRFVGEWIRERGWGGRRIGVEKDAYYYTLRWHEELQRGLGGVDLHDGDLLVNHVRAVKSEREIALMREAGRIAEKAMQTALDTVRPGVRECDAVAEITRAEIRGLPEAGGDYPAIVPMMPTGTKTSAAHLTWTDEPYQADQPVNLELAGCRLRYHSPLARTAFLGSQPPAALAELADRTVEGLNTTLDAIRPGMTCGEVEGVWRAYIARFGLKKESRIGYPIGLNYPPDWGEHTKSFRPGDPNVLAPNMTFHMIAGMWFDDYGFECSEAFRVTDTGVETFADFPRQLFLLE